MASQTHGNGGGEEKVGPDSMDELRADQVQNAVGFLSHPKVRIVCNPMLSCLGVWADVKRHTRFRCTLSTLTSCFRLTRRYEAARKTPRSRSCEVKDLLMLK